MKAAEAVLKYKHENLGDTWLNELAALIDTAAGIGELERELGQLRFTLEGGKAWPFIQERDALRQRLEALENENRILRGLVQTNIDWKCPYGVQVSNMGLCPLGFPGCACADDRIAVLCKDEDRIVSGLQKRLDAVVAQSTRLRAALELPLMFHSAGPWDDNKRKRWAELTGNGEATTRVICDAIRAALDGAQSK